MSNLYVFRGLPGSGKTTAAQKLGCLVINPWDDCSTKDGRYKYNENDVDVVNTYLVDQMSIVLKYGIDVAVCDVFPCKEDVKKLFELTYKPTFNSFGFLVIDLPITVEQSYTRNTHKVPLSDIQNMANKFEPWTEKDYREVFERREAYLSLTI